MASPGGDHGGSCSSESVAGVVALPASPPSLLARHVERAIRAVSPISSTVGGTASTPTSPPPAKQGSGGFRATSSLDTIDIYGDGELLAWVAATLDSSPVPDLCALGRNNVISLFNVTLELFELRSRQWKCDCELWVDQVEPNCPTCERERPHSRQPGAGDCTEKQRKAHSEMALNYWERLRNAHSGISWALTGIPWPLKLRSPRDLDVAIGLSAGVQLDGALSGPEVSLLRCLLRFLRDMHEDLSSCSLSPVMSPCSPGAKSFSNPLYMSPVQRQRTSSPPTSRDDSGECVEGLEARNDSKKNVMERARNKLRKRVAGALSPPPRSRSGSGNSSDGSVLKRLNLIRSSTDFSMSEGRKGSISDALGDFIRRRRSSELDPCKFNSSELEPEAISRGGANMIRQYSAELERRASQDTDRGSTAAQTQLTPDFFAISPTLSPTTDKLIRTSTNDLSAKSSGAAGGTDAAAAVTTPGKFEETDACRDAGTKGRGDELKEANVPKVIDVPKQAEAAGTEAPFKAINVAGESEFDGADAELHAPLLSSPPKRRSVKDVKALWEERSSTPKAELAQFTEATAEAQSASAMEDNAAGPSALPTARVKDVRAMWESRDVLPDAKTPSQECSSASQVVDPPRTEVTPKRRSRPASFAMGDDAARQFSLPIAKVKDVRALWESREVLPTPARRPGRGSSKNLQADPTPRRAEGFAAMRSLWEKGAGGDEEFRGKVLYRPASMSALGLSQSAQLEAWNKQRGQQTGASDRPQVKNGGAGMQGHIGPRSVQLTPSNAVQTSALPVRKSSCKSSPRLPAESSATPQRGMQATPVLGAAKGVQVGEQLSHPLDSSPSRSSSSPVAQGRDDRPPCPAPATASSVEDNENELPAYYKKRLFGEGSSTLSAKDPCSADLLPLSQSKQLEIEVQRERPQPRPFKSPAAHPLKSPPARSPMVSKPVAQARSALSPKPDADVRKSMPPPLPRQPQHHSPSRRESNFFTRMERVVQGILQPLTPSSSPLNSPSRRNHSSCCFSVLSMSHPVVVVKIIDFLRSADAVQSGMMVCKSWRSALDKHWISMMQDVAASSGYHVDHRHGLYKTILSKAMSIGLNKLAMLPTQLHLPRSSSACLETEFAKLVSKGRASIYASAIGRDVPRAFGRPPPHKRGDSGWQQGLLKGRSALMSLAGGGGHMWREWERRAGESDSVWDAIGLERKRECLRDILFALVASFPDAGYCQGMDRLVEHLMWTCVKSLQSSRSMSGHVVFNILSGLFESHRLSELYKPQTGGLLVCVEVLNLLVRARMPELAAHFTKLDFSLDMIAFGWFQTMFLTLQGMQRRTLCRIWDWWIACGDLTPLFQVSLAILSLNQATLLRIHEFDVMAEFFAGTAAAKVLTPGRTMRAAQAMAIHDGELMYLEQKVRTAEGFTVTSVMSLLLRPGIFGGDSSTGC